MDGAHVEELGGRGAEPGVVPIVVAVAFAVAKEVVVVAVVAAAAAAEVDEVANAAAAAAVCKLGTLRLDLLQGGEGTEEREVYSWGWGGGRLEAGRMGGGRG